MSKRTIATRQLTSGGTQALIQPSAKRPRKSKDNGYVAAKARRSRDLCLLNLPVEILTIICHFVQEEDTVPPPRPVATGTPVVTAPAVMAPVVNLYALVIATMTTATPVSRNEIPPSSESAPPQPVWVSGPASLLNFGLTCRYLHAVVTPVLYRTINPSHGLVSDEYFHEVDYQRLFRTLVSHPDLRSLIRHINIRISYKGMYEKYDSFRKTYEDSRLVHSALWDSSCLDSNDATGRRNYRRADRTFHRLLYDLSFTSSTDWIGYMCFLPLTSLCLATRLRSARVILDSPPGRRSSTLLNGYNSNGPGKKVVLCPHLDSLVIDGSFRFDGPRSCRRPRLASPVEWDPRILWLVAAMPRLRFLELRQFTPTRAWDSLRWMNPAMELPQSLVSLSMVHPTTLQRHAIDSILWFYRHLTRLRIFQDESTESWNVQRHPRTRHDPVTKSAVAWYFGSVDRPVLAMELVNAISRSPSGPILQSLCLHGCHQYHNYSRAPRERWRQDWGMFGLISHIKGLPSLRVLALDYRTLWPLDEHVLTTLIEALAALEGFMLYYADGLLPEDLLTFAQDVSQKRFPRLKTVKLVNGAPPKGTREPKRNRLWKQTKYQPLRALATTPILELFGAGGVKLIIQDRPDDDPEGAYTAFEREMRWWP
ncbi:hypothetical protein QBC41DRAFT_145255 [Cercophora samala]|uniref:Uncharacterized protein n=1 Tax=Cercophora samala TaxID=330535 RepID=A0AA39Z9X2_9PEZI|nr:hypothetical protein QBC41DRAFT_145255 [Cercophora samala]